MINSKKGLSDIVTNVLIILLVLIAVGIIWRFVLPVITQSSSAVGGVSDCITVNIKPISCINSGVADNGYGTVTIQRGTGTAKLLGIRILLTRLNGPSVAFDDTSAAATGLTELSSYNFDSTLQTLNEFTPGDKIQVAPIVSDGANGNKVCPLSPVTAVC